MNWLRSFLARWLLPWPYRRIRELEHRIGAMAFEAEVQASELVRVRAAARARLGGDCEKHSHAPLTVLLKCPACLADANKFILDVLRLLARHELTDSIWWRTDGEYSPVTFFVNCNDLFEWGCADAEPITPENLPQIATAIEHCVAVDPCCASTGLSLFACRGRGQRPQRPAYPKDKRFWPLFDGCGPEEKPGCSA